MRKATFDLRISVNIYDDSTLGAGHAMEETVAQSIIMSDDVSSVLAEESVELVSVDTQ